MYVYHMYVMPLEARRGHRIPLSWRYCWFMSYHVDAGNGALGSLQKQVLLNTEPSLVPSRLLTRQKIVV